MARLKKPKYQVMPEMEAMFNEVQALSDWFEDWKRSHRKRQPKQAAQRGSSNKLNFKESISPKEGESNV